MNLWESIEAANGEIRLQPVRYGRGWYCLIVTYQDADDLGVWERWEDLISGDTDWSEAEDYFRSADAGIHLATGPDPQSALAAATERAERERAW